MKVKQPTAAPDAPATADGQKSAQPEVTRCPVPPMHRGTPIGDSAPQTSRQVPVLQKRGDLLDSLVLYANPRQWVATGVAAVGPTFRVAFSEGPAKQVITTEPQVVQALFRLTGDQVRMAGLNQTFESVLGPSSILMLDGAAHQRERRLFMPAFQGERIRQYGDAMKSITNEVIDTWKVGQRLTLVEDMKAITVKIIVRVVFGIEDAEQAEKLRRALLQMVERSVLLMALPGLQKASGAKGPWGAFLQERDNVYRLLDEAIATRKRDPNLAARQDILSMLLQARDEKGERMSDSEVRDELLTMLVAGYETTATSLAWMLLYVLQDPTVQTKLAEERARVTAGNLEPGHVQRLTYAKAVWNEALRLGTIVPFVSRELRVDMELGGVQCKAGDIVTAAIAYMHRAKELWNEPDAFKPERFLGNVPFDPGMFLPFGGGVRRCIGASLASYEGALILSQILERADFQLLSKSTKAARRGLTLVPADGTRVRVRTKR